MLGIEILEWCAAVSVTSIEILEQCAAVSGIKAKNLGRLSEEDCKIPGQPMLQSEFNST